MPAGDNVICVLGMHRSGTSSLTGSLEEAGLVLGSVNTEAPFNRKGNRENRAIMDLNEGLLQRNGGSWDAPPETVAWADEDRARRDEIIAGYPAGTRWGFKDPRTLFTLEGWREALPAMRYVGTFRHPVAVAESVGARSRWPVERGLGVWLAYNRRLLRRHRELGFPLLSFDVSPDRYEAGLRDVCGHLGLTLPAGGFRFFEAELRHRAATGTDGLPAEFVAVYDELRDAARSTCPA